MDCILADLPCNIESDRSDCYSEIGHSSEAKGYQSVMCQEASTEGTPVPLPETALHWSQLGFPQRTRKNQAQCRAKGSG